MQLLEGGADAIDTALARIGKDPRHKNIVVIDEGKLVERNFGDWSMAFKRGTAEQFAAIEGYTDPKKVIECSASEEHPALIMLKTFVETNLA